MPEMRKLSPFHFIKRIMNSIYYLGIGVLFLVENEKNRFKNV
jgi:hypothetical protein